MYCYILLVSIFTAWIAVKRAQSNDDCYVPPGHTLGEIVDSTKYEPYGG